MDTVTVTRFAEKKIKKGICRLEKGELLSVSGEEGLVYLQSPSGEGLGQAYLSPQNKAIGWFVTPAKTPLQVSFFVALFRKARQAREVFRQSELTTAYRLFHQDGDGFGGLTIDRYDDYAVFSWYNVFVYSLKEVILSAFQEVFPDIKGAYEKIRFKGPEQESAFLYGQEAPAAFPILENGVAYQVFLNEGLMTGIFLDQHDVRGQLVDGLASGKSVLNMFSYTAAFSVAAAMGGAVQTVSVDLAKRSRELSEAHFIANGLDLEPHRFIVMDVFEYFQYAKRKGLTFDVVILDPPSFARNKKQTFSVAKDYHKLVRQAVDLLEEDGILIASTNAENVTLAKFKNQVEKGLEGQPHRYLRTDRLPSDFRYNKKDESGNYLKVFTIQVKK